MIVSIWNNREWKIRPIDKPIHVPSKNDKVSQIPKEWQKLESESVNGKYNIPITDCTLIIIGIEP